MPPAQGLGLRPQRASSSFRPSSVACAPCRRFPAKLPLHLHPRTSPVRQRFLPVAGNPASSAKEKGWRAPIMGHGLLYLDSFLYRICLIFLELVQNKHRKS